VKRTHFGFWRAVLLILGVLVVLAGIFVVTVVMSSSGARGEVEKTRQELKRQGFKTDLAEFDFRVPANEQGFQMSLERLESGRLIQQEPLGEFPLMQSAGPDSAIVIWKEDSVLTRQANYSWPDFSYALAPNDPAFIEARADAISGPIRFNLDASRGMAMSLPHLAVMKWFMFKCNEAMVVDLHNNDRATAWTNLLASTRLVTAWEPGPSDVCQAVRFALMTMTFESTWEALQANDWSDEQLATLQQDWESVDFFKSLPETMAFKRAATVEACETQRKEMMESFHPGEVFKEVARSPRESPQILRMLWTQWRYLNGGAYDDKKSLLLFYRDREVEMQNAVKAPSWRAMEPMPGVTNQATVTSKYRSSVVAMLNMRQIGVAIGNRGGGLLGRAAQAETYRRLLITAIALERFRIRHGHYPLGLDELVPEFLKQPAIDFMDGQPLRYRLGADERFVLYSTGPDCVDDGGVMRAPANRRGIMPGYPGGVEETVDLVWPRPATTNEIAMLHEQELQERRGEEEFRQRAVSEDYWNRTAMRQARADSSMVTPEAEINDQSLKGRRVNEMLRNPNLAGTNTLFEMLTLHQVITGAEGETITFEAPINFDTLTNAGELSLLIDFNKSDEDRDEGGSAAQVEVSRATNGNCRLAWHTIFESPGKHTLQMGLLLQDGNWEKMIAGPVMMMEVTNLCQFSEASANFDRNTGAWLIGRLPEKKANYSVEILTPDGKRVKTISGDTSNGVLQVFWDLIGDDGRKLEDESFGTVFHITLPESGKTQTLKGP